MSNKTQNHEIQPSLFDLLPEAEVSALDPGVCSPVTEDTPKESAPRPFNPKWLKKTGKDIVEKVVESPKHYLEPVIGETKYQWKVTPLPETSQEAHSVTVRRDAFYNDKIVSLLECVPVLDKNFWAYSIMKSEEEHIDKHKGEHHIPAGPKEFYLRSQKDKFVADYENKHGQRPPADEVLANNLEKQKELEKGHRTYLDAKEEYKWHADAYFKSYYETLMQNLHMHEVRLHDKNADIVDHIYAFFEGSDFKRVFKGTVGNEYLEVSSNGAGKKGTMKFVDKVKSDPEFKGLNYDEIKRARRQLVKNAEMQRSALLEEKSIYDTRHQMKTNDIKEQTGVHKSSSRPALMRSFSAAKKVTLNKDELASMSYVDRIKANGTDRSLSDMKPITRSKPSGTWPRATGASFSSYRKS